jgi:hypothetical protein
MGAILKIKMTFTITDYIIGGLFFFYFWRGWCKGFLRTIIGPGAFIISLLAGILYFDLTQNIPKTLGVILIGTLALSIILKIIFFFGRQSLDKKDRKYIFIGSRLLGGTINLGCKGALTMGSLFLFLNIPSHLFDIEKYQEPIRKSQAYALFAQRVLPRIPQAVHLTGMMDRVTNPSRVHELADYREYREFMADEKVQDLLTDTEVQQMIKENNMKDLMIHPKFLQIMQDDKLMKQMTKFGKHLYADIDAEHLGGQSTKPRKQ